MNLNFVLNVLLSFCVRKLSISSVTFAFTGENSDHLSSNERLTGWGVALFWFGTSGWSGWVGTNSGVDLCVKFLIGLG